MAILVLYALKATYDRLCDVANVSRLVVCTILAEMLLVCFFFVPYKIVHVLVSLLPVTSGGPSSHDALGEPLLQCKIQGPFSNRALNLSDVLL